MTNATHTSSNGRLNESQNEREARHEEFWDVLYDELRRRARDLMRRQPSHHTLTGTALLHEVYMKLTRSRKQTWDDRKHFLAVASTAMRQVLVDHARRVKAGKRPPKDMAVQLDLLLDQIEAHYADITELNDALERFRELDPVMYRAIELRVFGSATLSETAKILGMSVRTLERNYQPARAMLLRLLRP